MIILCLKYTDIVSEYSILTGTVGDNELTVSVAGDILATLTVDELLPVVLTVLVSSMGGGEASSHSA